MSKLYFVAVMSIGTIGIILALGLVGLELQCRPVPTEIVAILSSVITGLFGLFAPTPLTIDKQQ